MNSYAISDKRTGELIRYIEAANASQAYDMVEGLLGEAWRYNIDLCTPR